MLDRLTQTERDIIISLKLLGECDAESIAERLRLSVSAVRASLQVLRLSGQVQIRREGHGVGRKRFYYSLSEDGQRLFPSGNARVAASILGRVAEAAPAEFRNAVQSQANRYRANAVSSWSPTSPADRPEVIAGDFEEFGYLAQAEPAGEGGESALRLYHCPFLDLVRENPWMCDVEGELIAEGASAEVTRTEHQLNGDRACVYRLRFDKSHGFTGSRA
ncbi:MAG: hypothetical protein U5Q44_11120 [Dehalococcoidia bacterium]|nr:hypothetical protein [Dehalococcoidia bacterium]